MSTSGQDVRSLDGYDEKGPGQVLGFEKWRILDHTDPGVCLLGDRLSYIDSHYFWHPPSSGGHV